MGSSASFVDGWQRLRAALTLQEQPCEGSCGGLNPHSHGSRAVQFNRFYPRVPRRLLVTARLRLWHSRIKSSALSRIYTLPGMHLLPGVGVFVGKTSPKPKT